MSSEDLQTATAIDVDSLIADTAQTIRKVVGGGLQNGCYAVHVGNCNFSMSSTEGEAFQATYAGEESFRGHLAKAFIELAAVYGRLLTADEEYKAVASSTYIWQPKAEILRHLLPRATRCLEQSELVFATARERGLLEKMTALSASRERLQRLITDVETALNKRK